jgi:hypothetical protein
MGFTENNLLPHSFPQAIFALWPKHHSKFFARFRRRRGHVFACMPVLFAGLVPYHRSFTVTVWYPEAGKTLPIYESMNVAVRCCCCFFLAAVQLLF